MSTKEQENIFIDDEEKTDPVLYGAVQRLIRGDVPRHVHIVSVSGEKLRGLIKKLADNR